MLPRPFQGERLEAAPGRKDRAQKAPPARYVARFPGLVDIVEDADGKPTFLVLEDGKPILLPDWQGHIPPPCEQMPFLLPAADAVLGHYQGARITPSSMIWWPTI